MDQEGGTKATRKPKPRPKKYPCPMENCEKAYSRPCLLEQHIRSHNDERPYLCNVPGCEKAFLRDSHLKTHLLSHSVEKPLYCSYCGKGFNTNQHLNRHERTHVPSVRCTYQGCEMAFRRASQLRKHVSDCHTFRKEHQCPYCSRQFDLQARLEAHIKKSHANAAMPSYHCGEDGCSHVFPTWQGLQEHVKMSHKTIPCYCGQKFTSETLLADHVKTCHPSNTGSSTQQSPSSFQDLYTQEWHCREAQCIPVPNCVFRDKDSLIYHYQQFHGFVPDALQVQVLTPASSMEGLPPLTALGGADQNGQQATPYFQSYHVAQRRDPTTGTSGLIERITGSGYDVHRRIMCPIPDCHYRFAREYDLRRHVKAKHPQLISDGKMIVDYKVVPEFSVMYPPHSKVEPSNKYRSTGVPLSATATHTPHNDLSPASNSPSPASFNGSIKQESIDDSLENQNILPPLPAFVPSLGSASAHVSHSQQAVSGITLQGASILQRHPQHHHTSHPHTEPSPQASITSSGVPPHNNIDSINQQQSALDAFLTHHDILNNGSSHIQLNISGEMLNENGHHYTSGSKSGQVFSPHQHTSTHHNQNIHYSSQAMQHSQSLPVPLSHSPASNIRVNHTNSPVPAHIHSQSTSLQPSRSHTPIYPPQANQIYTSVNSGSSSLSTTPSAGGSPYQGHNSNHNSPQAQGHHFQQFDNRASRTMTPQAGSGAAQEIDPMILNGSV